jgi:hypothetical protein
MEKFCFRRKRGGRLVFETGIYYNKKLAYDDN